MAIGVISIQASTQSTLREKIESIVKGTNHGSGETEVNKESNITNQDTNTPDKKEDTTEKNILDVSTFQKEKNDTDLENSNHTLEKEPSTEKKEKIVDSSNMNTSIGSTDEEKNTVLSSEQSSSSSQVSEKIESKKKSSPSVGDHTLDNIIDVLELSQTSSIATYTPNPSSNIVSSSEENESPISVAPKTNSTNHVTKQNNDSSAGLNSVEPSATVTTPPVINHVSEPSIRNSVPDTTVPASTVVPDSSSDLIPDSTASYTNDITGTGKGPVLDISIQYHVKDKKGRCGKGSSDYCAAVATVKYTTGTVKYYMGYQNNSKLLSGSCRSHAFISATNAIKGTKYSTLDLQNYLYSVGYKGVLKTKGIDKSIQHYGLSAKVYHSETSRTASAQLIKQALDNGQPVMIFVQHSLCSDLAGTHHALLLLGYDKNGKVVFIDSASYSKKAKKRTADEISKCLSKNSIADSYYRMIIFSF